MKENGISKKDRNRDARITGGGGLQKFLFFQFHDL